jgi:AraC family transcriptional regulator, arabinose operon regulatory protein
VDPHGRNDDLVVLAPDVVADREEQSKGCSDVRKWTTSVIRDDRPSGPVFEIRDQFHMAADLPRRWITLPPAVRRKALSHPLLKTLLPSHVGFFPDARHHEIRRPEGVEQAIFKYCVRGSGWCEIEGRTSPVNLGDLMVVPPNVPHAYGSSQKRPWTVYWFHAVGQHLEALFAELGVGRAQPVVHLGRDMRLVALLQDLEQVYEDDYAFPQLLYASQLLAHIVGVMICLRRNHLTRVPDARQRVLQSAERIKQRLDKPLDVAQQASLANLSLSHYSALFRSLTGDSPKAYFRRLRLHRAARLLMTTDQSVATIARQMGYDDPLYFSRIFRRVHGVSPSKYRERLA